LLAGGLHQILVSTPRSSFSFLVYAQRPWPSFTSSWRQVQTGVMEARILVPSLGNVPFAYLIKELGTSRQLRTHLLFENLFENSS
jgi:hypothetical protein